MGGISVIDESLIEVPQAPFYRILTSDMANEFPTRTYLFLLFLHDDGVRPCNDVSFCSAEVVRRKQSPNYARVGD